jgi:hypothetical protein
MFAIQIKMKNDYNNFIGKIFLGVDLSTYFWNIEYEEIIPESTLSIGLLYPKEFLNLFFSQEYYVVFLDMKAFNKVEEICHIETLDQFISSECQLMVLCYDSIYCEIYSKNPDVISSIKTNCINERGLEFFIMNAEKLPRTKFNI